MEKLRTIAPFEANQALVCIVRLKESNMVKIRLARRGAKKRPFYHIVIADQRCARDGRYIEHIGFFNPIAAGKDEPVRIDLSRVDHWLATGAQMTDRVRDLVREYRKNPPVVAQAAK